MGEKLLIGLLRFSFANGEREFHGGREGSILMFRRIKVLIDPMPKVTLSLIDRRSRKIFVNSPYRSLSLLPSLFFLPSNDRFT